nr:phosphotransferase [uncultured Friedmanniella sp.]
MTNASTASVPSTLEAVESLLCTRDLRLQRAWPRDEHHLLLEASTGRASVAGQWFASADRAAEVAGKTPGAELLGPIVLQPDGADRRLPGLASLLRGDGAELVTHRPEKRAVVRLPRSGGPDAPAYAKVVRRSVLETVARSARAAAGLPVRTPPVLRVDARDSAVVTAALPGRILHDLLDTPAALHACRAAGRALALVHRSPVPPGLRRHHDADELAVLRRWQQLALAHGLAPAFPVPAVDLPGRPVGDGQHLAPIHRDFHDKQVVVADDGEVGVLDFDLMALGAPMLDLANFLVHLDLRAVQRLVADAGPLRGAVLEGYQPTEAQVRQLSRHEQTTWQRLAAVYAFRPPRSTT